MKVNNGNAYLICTSCYETLVNCQRDLRSFIFELVPGNKVCDCYFCDNRIEKNAQVRVIYEYTGGSDALPMFRAVLSLEKKMYELDDKIFKDYILKKLTEVITK